MAAFTTALVDGKADIGACREHHCLVCVLYLTIWYDAHQPSARTRQLFGSHKERDLLRGIKLPKKQTRAG